MDFKERYVSETDKTLEPTTKKRVISDEAFAIGELLQAIIYKLEKARIK